MHIIENNVDFVMVDLVSHMSREPRSGRAILQKREIHAFSELSGLIEEYLSEGVTGEFVVSSGDNTGSIYITEGSVAWVTASSVFPTLLEMLEAKGHVSRDALIAACEVSIAAGDNLAEQLVNEGVLPRDVLVKTLKQHLAYPLSEIIRWNEGVVEFHPHSSLGWSSYRFTFGELMGRALLLLDYTDIFAECRSLERGPSHGEQNNVPMISDAPGGAVVKGIPAIPVTVQRVRSMRIHGCIETSSQPHLY